MSICYSGVFDNLISSCTQGETSRPDQKGDDAYCSLPSIILRLVQALLNTSGHACEETVPVIGHWLLMRSDKKYEKAIDDERYPDSVKLFHSMFRLAIRVFGIDVHRQGFFADATTLYNLWSTSYGQLLSLSQYRPTAKSEPDSATYGNFVAADHEPMSDLAYESGAESDEELEARDLRSLFTSYFPGFDIAGLDDRSMSVLTGDSILPTHDKPSTSQDNGQYPTSGPMSAIASSGTLSSLTSMETSSGDNSTQQAELNLQPSADPNDVREPLRTTPVPLTESNSTALASSNNRVAYSSIDDEAPIDSVQSAKLVVS